MTDTSTKFDNTNDLSLSTQNNQQRNRLGDDNHTKAEEIWKKFLELLTDNLKESEIKTWFAVISPKSFVDNVLTILVPSEDFYGMIERRYNKLIVKILNSGLLGDGGKLKYEITQASLFDNSENANLKTDDQNKIIRLGNPYRFFDNNIQKTQDVLPKIKLTGVNEQEQFSSNLYSKYTFDNFVKGDSNELAVAAAYAITNNPGKTYNPFFVYGGVGLGKTHLVQAIGNEILKKYQDKKIYYTTAPDFTTQFTTNIARDKIDFSSTKVGTKKLDSFYKSLDVLILDDIQNFEGKPGTQDFMYQIFNTLFNNKGHIIFSCDKPLNKIKDIEERLISRFQWGITVDIQPPSWEMRVAIIQKKFYESNIEVPEDVIHYIATNVKDSIRTLEGCIIGMIAESTFIYKGEINFEVAEKVINRVIGQVKKSKNVSIENIIYSVANHYNISENQILSRKRTRDIAFARQVAMYLAKELTNFTLESIGLNFGGKDHATVLYSHKAIRDLIKKNSLLYNEISEIKEKINNL
ncbi:chromosomal replication initiator protein DnaA [Bacteroidota bacterium]